MGFFASLLGGGALQALVSALAGPLENIFHDYIQGKISKEQLQEQIQAAMLQAFAQIEAQYLDSITKTYTSFIQAASTNPVMAKAWSVVLYSQLFVLLWHQLAIPAIALAAHTFGDPHFIYPSSGITADWGYAVVCLCLGAPAIASRIGPASGWVASTIKGLMK